MEQFLDNHVFLTTCFTTGLVFIITSIVQSIYPPKKINSFYGYRTKQSKSSQKKWDLAQKYSAAAMMWSGIALVFVSPLDFILDMSVFSSVFFAVIMILTATFITMILVEKRLKNVK